MKPFTNNTAPLLPVRKAGQGLRSVGVEAKQTKHTISKLVLNKNNNYINNSINSNSNLKIKHPTTQLEKILNKYYPLNSNSFDSLTDGNSKRRDILTGTKVQNPKSASPLDTIEDFIKFNKLKILNLKSTLKSRSSNTTSDSVEKEKSSVLSDFNPGLCSPKTFTPIQSSSSRILTEAQQSDKREAIETKESKTTSLSVPAVGCEGKAAPSSEMVVREYDKALAKTDKDTLLMKNSNAITNESLSKIDNENTSLLSTLGADIKGTASTGGKATDNIITDNSELNKQAENPVTPFSHSLRFADQRSYAAPHPLAKHESLKGNEYNKKNNYLHYFFKNNVLNKSLNSDNLNIKAVNSKFKNLTPSPALLPERSREQSYPFGSAGKFQLNKKFYPLKKSYFNKIQYKSFLNQFILLNKEFNKFNTYNKIFKYPFVALLTHLTGGFVQHPFAKRVRESRERREGLNLSEVLYANNFTASLRLRDSGSALNCIPAPIEGEDNRTNKLENIQLSINKLEQINENYGKYIMHHVLPFTKSNTALRDPVGDSMNRLRFSSVKDGLRSLALAPQPLKDRVAKRRASEESNGFKGEVENNVIVKKETPLKFINTLNTFKYLQLIPSLRAKSGKLRFSRYFKNFNRSRLPITRLFKDFPQFKFFFKFISFASMNLRDERNKKSNYLNYILWLFKESASGVGGNMKRNKITQSKNNLYFNLELMVHNAELSLKMIRYFKEIIFHLLTNSVTLFKLNSDTAFTFISNKVADGAASVKSAHAIFESQSEHYQEARRVQSACASHQAQELEIIIQNLNDLEESINKLIQVYKHKLLLPINNNLDSTDNNLFASLPALREGSVALDSKSNYSANKTESNNDKFLIFNTLPLTEQIKLLEFTPESYTCYLKDRYFVNYVNSTLSTNLPKYHRLFLILKKINNYIINLINLTSCPAVTLPILFASQSDQRDGADESVAGGDKDSERAQVKNELIYTNIIPLLNIEASSLFESSAGESDQKDAEEKGSESESSNLSPRSASLLAVNKVAAGEGWLPIKEGKPSVNKLGIRRYFFRYNNMHQIGNSQSIVYNFNQNLKRMNTLDSMDHSGSLIKYNVSVLLKYFFKIIGGALISKPVFIFKNNKIIIKLYFFLKKNIYFFNNNNKNLQYFLLKNSTSTLLNRASAEMSRRVNKWLFFKKTKHIFKNVINSKRLRTVRGTETNNKLLKKVNNIIKENILKNKLNFNILSIYRKEFNALTFVLENYFNCSVQLEITRLKYPFFDSNILAQIIGLNGKFYNFERIIKLLFPKILIRNPNTAVGKQMIDLSPKKKRSIASYLSGIKIKVAGRFYKHRIIPRRTTSIVQRGSLARGVVNFVDSSRYVNKSRRGSFSITVNVSHIY